MIESSSRPATAIDAIADAWTATAADLDPTLATYIGFPGRLGEFGDTSPAGHENFVAEAKKVIAQLAAAVPAGDVDVVTRTDLSSELGLLVESFDAGMYLRDVNVIASPAQELRSVFDLMPTQTEADWVDISNRLGNLPAAIDGYIETLRLGIERGMTPARRQVRAVALQAENYARPDGFFTRLTAGTKGADGELPASLTADLASGAAVAAEAYRELAVFMKTTLEPVATEQDAIGRELYALASRRFLGARIDLDETYEWGREELARMVAEQQAVAREIKAGATVPEAVEFLDRDPGRKLHGTAALQRWMQETSDRAIEELGRSTFEIPDPIRTLECMIAPTQEGGIYYTGPTDDFSRPGRMWWSVPEGVTEFDTWRELTTVYHEGVPGHHLQIGQAVHNRAQLNSWRRLLAGTSGHAEGWALYAERLMQELGFLDDPADRLGMLDGQRMRAARVVLDLGVHLGKPRLDGTGVWDHDYALDFFRGHVNMNDEFIKFEVNRYLGWPGQAPSYKVGQRIWQQLREETEAREGSSFDLRRFHKRALDLGSVGLDTLRSALRASPSR